MILERWWLILRMRIASLVHGRRVDADMDDELREHIEREIEQHVSAGMTRADARTAALRALGGLQQRREEIRDTRGFSSWLNVGRDLRYALRMLFRRPGFSIVAVVTLAISIGANTAIFAVVNGVLLQPMPFPEPERLVLISSAPADPLFGRALGLHEQQFLDFRKGDTLFEHVTSFSSQSVTLTGIGDPLRVGVAAVTPEFFDTLRVAPSIGRTFLPGEDEPERNRTIVVSDALWKSQFQASREAIGQHVKIDGVDHEVIGIMPEGFSFPDAPVAWTPLKIQVQRGIGLTRSVVGRLRPGVSLPQAQSELEALAPGPQMSSPSPGSANAGPPRWQTVVLPLKERAVGQIRQPLAVLAAGVAFVLLIGCGNVANLFLVRMAERERELSVRVALGADRRRLVQQLLAESGVVAVIGGAAGVLLAAWALPVLLTLAPPGTIPRADLIHIDGRVLWFTAAVALTTSLLFGLLPAFRATRPSAARVQSQRTHTTRHERLHTSLVVIEIALSVVLLTGAGLMLKSFLRLSAVDTGFNTENVVTATVDLPRSTFRTAEDAQTFHAQVLANVASVSGVRAAGAVNWLPFGLMSMMGDLALDGGRPLPRSYMVDKPAVSAGYFGAMGIRVLQGRVFTDQDGATAQPVAIVSRAVAADLWPGENAVGQRVSLEAPPKTPEDWLTVVGVVEDIRQQDLRDERSRAIYQSYLQVPRLGFLSHMSYVVRTESSPAAALPGIRTAMRAVDPLLPVPSITSMSTLLSARTATPAFQARLLLIFASIALALTVVGIYGVLAYSVSQRTREFGIRLALGARMGSVLRVVLWRTLGLASLGTAIGTAAGLVLTRLLKQLLFEVTPTDPATFVAVIVVLATAAVAAAVIPAWRAARVDPTIALRAE